MKLRFPGRLKTGSMVTCMALGLPLSAAPAPAAELGSAHPKDEPLLIEQQAEKRDAMMTVHQAVGLGTLALLLGAGVTGAMLVGTNDPTTRLLHQGFVASGTALYLTGGVLAIAAPKPYSLGDDGFSSGIDNITMHRWLAALHLAGMGAAVYTGLTATRLWQTDPTLSIRRTHPILGATSIVLVATSATVMLLNF